MKKKVPLTIVLTASMSFGVALADQAKAPTTQSSSAISSQTASSDASYANKCASGKCGSHTKSNKAQTVSQKSVKVQDSSCGNSKCASGSCGSHTKSKSDTSTSQAQDNSNQTEVKA
ncbi:hypothetical protein [Francisella sp. 19X1-34]|uniref:hypothetical protein n=1 Tax=Francisella sp. 19X1-34 TaxID=3087177 RepID=UPI002E342BF6|nr:hypothetical protein [Francisella sp. 19X1-34]MED7788008.1 hypothetical protein [Francisella sp. 19X1-34]